MTVVVRCDHVDTAAIAAHHLEELLEVLIRESTVTRGPRTQEKTEPTIFAADIQHSRIGGYRVLLVAKTTEAGAQAVREVPDP